MFLRRQTTQLRGVYHDYPQPFWLLMGATFIDRVGGALLFPFFSLYITAHFGVGMTTVGLLFALFSITSVVGSTIGGALSDRWGRKSMLLVGLVASALSSLTMGFAADIRVLFAAAVFVGLFSSVGGPAQQAMVADLLPEEKRAEGYGVWRIIANIAVVIGPAIGGLMAARSYLALFVTDAVTSVVMAAIVWFALAETRPETPADSAPESVWQTFRGYGVPLRDGIFMVFILASMLATIVYMQMNTTLAVFLRDVHGVPAQGYGYLLSLNAAMVVLFQFWITRRLRQRPPLVMMALGTVLYAVGFGLYGVVSTYALFVVAMIILTIGEMVTVPVAQAIVARLSPEAMRGRYMAVYGFAWTLPSAVGPLLAGVVMDYYNPRWVWYFAFLFALVSAAMYQTLYGRTRRQTVAL